MQLRICLLLGCLLWGTQAGAQQWGAAMQDDVTDATRWAIEQKIADPQRICLYGASYGGYAALMGVAKEPALYRCAAGYVGVYDLELMHRQKSRHAKWLGNYMDDWVGDERAALADISPTSLATKIRVPVFLAAGGKDEIAPQAHTERMEKALKAAGYLPVTYDSLVTGWQDAVKFGPFEKGDLMDRERQRG